MSRRPLLAALAAAAALAGCAPGVRVEVSPTAGYSAPPAAEVAALIELEDRRAYEGPRLAALAAHEHPLVRARTARTLGRIRDARGVPALLTLLADGDTAVAAAAAFALGQVGDTAAASQLAARLEAPARTAAPTVAAEAASALGKLQSRAARDALVGVLGADDPMRPAAAAAVGEALLAIWRHPRLDDRTPILRWMTSPDVELRWRAVYALVRRPDPAAVGTLRALARDPDARVRMLVMRGLSRAAADSAGVASAELVPLLAAGMRDADYTVRVGAARTLGSHPGAASVAALGEALASPERHLVVVALESVQRLGREAAALAPRADAIARDVAAPVALRTAALDALAESAPETAAATARALAGAPEWRLRAAAGRALARLDAAGAQALLRDADPRVVSATLGARVAAAGDTLAPLRGVLVDALGAQDVQLRTMAIGALGRMRDPAHLPLLLDAYEQARADADNDAALAAVEALGLLQQSGSAPERAFFLRFARSEDPLVRSRVDQTFGAAARAAWGEPLPIETGRAAAEYLALAQREVGAALRPAARPRVRLTTEAGVIVVELFEDLAPITVANLGSLARRGYFDGQEWPRVVPNFVVQGGDPRGDMSGGPGYAIRDELNRARYLTGTLGMALSGPDTGGSQWFITHSPQPHLDGGYTVFGRVVEGQAVTERILPGERILRIELLTP